MNHIRHYFLLPVLALCLCAGLAACSGGGNGKPTSTSSSGIATIACDASFENILSQEIDVFEYIYPTTKLCAKAR